MSIAVVYDIKKPWSSGTWSSALGNSGTTKFREAEPSVVLLSCIGAQERSDATPWGCPAGKALY